MGTAPSRQGHDPPFRGEDHGGHEGEAYEVDGEEYGVGNQIIHRRQNGEGAFVVGADEEHIENVIPQPVGDQQGVDTQIQEHGRGGQQGKDRYAPAQPFQLQRLR